MTSSLKLFLKLKLHIYKSVKILYLWAYQSYIIYSVYMYVSNLQVYEYFNLNPDYDTVLCPVYLFWM